MPRQGLAVPLVMAHDLRSGRAFRPTYAKNEDYFPILLRCCLYKAIGRLNLHPVCTPSEAFIWRRIPFSDQVDPKRVLNVWFHDFRLERKALLCRADLDAL